MTIGFRLQSATKIFKIGLQSAVGLQSATSLDYKLRWDYKALQVTKWYSTPPLIALPCLPPLTNPGVIRVKMFVLKHWVFIEVIWNFNPLSASPTKLPNTLKQFVAIVGKLPTNCLSVFGNFVNLALKVLTNGNR